MIQIDQISDERLLVIGRQYNAIRKAASLDVARIVYFLRAGPFVKIGCARVSPSKRIRQLQTGCPYPIELLAWMPGGQELERPLHRRFSHLRAHGEWFHGTPALLAGIEQVLSEQYQ